MAIIFWYIRVKLHIPFHFVSRQNLRYLALSLVFVPITLGIRAADFGYIWTAVLSVGVLLPVLFWRAVGGSETRRCRFLAGKLFSRLKRS